MREITLAEIIQRDSGLQAKVMAIAGKIGEAGSMRQQDTVILKDLLQAHILAQGVIQRLNKGSDGAPRLGLREPLFSVADFHFADENVLTPLDE